MVLGRSPVLGYFKNPSKNIGYYCGFKVQGMQARWPEI